MSSRVGRGLGPGNRGWGLQQGEDPGWAWVSSLHAYHVGREEIHQVALDTLAAIEQRLGAHVEHADVLPRQALLLDQPPHRRPRHRHDVLVLVAGAPLLHLQPIGVLAFAVVLHLECVRLHAVPRHVHLDRVDARVPLTARRDRSATRDGEAAAVDAADHESTKGTHLAHTTSSPASERSLLRAIVHKRSLRTGGN